MKKLQITHLLAAIILTFFASCTTEQAVFTSAEEDNTIERIDMSVAGNGTELFYVQSGDANSELVNYVSYGSPSHEVDIHINLDANRKLVIKLIDNAGWNPWEQEAGFSMFATRDLDDKDRYAIVQMEDGTEFPSYKSNIGDSFPGGTSVNVFNIQDFNPANNEMFARIINLELKSTTGEETITINGTFHGIVSFLN